MMVPKEQLSKRIEILNSYENSIGLIKKEAPGSYDELKTYLTLNKDQIGCLSQKESYCISARLAQFSIYFRRCINEERSNKTYAQSELNKIVAFEAQQLDQWMKWDQKVSIIAKTNQVASDWHNILIYATQRIERLESIADDIKNLGYIISLIGKTNG